MPPHNFKPKCLCLDIETAVADVFEIHKLATWRPDTGKSINLNGSNIAASTSQLDELTDGAAFVLGHNVRRHDLPVLLKLFPDLGLHALPVVDTLELSPVAFPQNPYHSLVKDYKLVRDSRSDPLKDAQLALKLWADQYAAFEALKVALPDELACHHFFLSRDVRVGVGSFFASIRGALAPTKDEIRPLLPLLTAGKVCPNQLRVVVDDVMSDIEAGRVFSYVLAWLRVSGGNSVLPPWVRLQFPQVMRQIRLLRETPCDDPNCPYCSVYLDPCKELERYFGFGEFRAEPKNLLGGSLQEEIVRLCYAGKSLLAILPTGGGKSICYQLPALSRHWRNGSLTIIISPLQSLMKDQVDNLVRVGIYSSATLNGLLTMPERRDVLDKVRLGDIGILLVSPEQFRNRAFVNAIRHRQIGAWVFDEAHCLSKWGNDFRPDYLYVSRFIREKYATGPDGLAPVCCFTATAKSEVIADIHSHFKNALGIDLTIFDGGHERDNLHYEVVPVARAEKMGVIGRLLENEFGLPTGQPQQGGAVVFAARRKSAEEISGFLKDLGWACAHFHAGMDAGVKKDVQAAFIEGSLKVIVATNAFGMGVDKPDVRMVIHAEIPGSLENYLQEAGRAGRDRKDSRCILLYDEEDVEAQFSISARSRLSRQDIANILRTLRRYSARTKSAEVVLTPGEILADDELETSIEAENPDADTKVRAAIAWLERARFLERNENHTQVFPGSLRVDSLIEADARLQRANLSLEMTQKYRELLSFLINAPEDEGISTDELMIQLGVSSDECVRMLHQLEQLGILTNDMSLTVLLRRGVRDASMDRIQRLARMESATLDLLPELAPDAGSGEWQDMSLRGVCQELKNRADLDFLPEQLLMLMSSLARPFGEDGGGRRASFEVRVLRRETLRVKLLRSWANIREISDRRRAVATVLLTALLGKLDERVRGVDLWVECKLGELAEALRRDILVGPILKDELIAIEAGLLYLHDNHVLILDRGKTVFRSAMTIKINPEEKRGFANTDFEPLKEHYGEKDFQIHAINTYATLGLRKISEALTFVLAYFTLPKLDFIRRYFAGRKEMLERATTEGSYRRIVENLKHPLQQRLVAEKPDANRLILAGPGSGKTRVIVHRVAYLVRVLREAPNSIIVLAFNRSAAWEVRERLRGLIGNDAAGVTVLTYHSLALRLTGTSMKSLADRGAEANFDQILDDALALLQGKVDLVGFDGEVDELRGRLLAGYHHILIDEYQDIDQRQYDLISALAGRKLADADGKLTVLAVGDDDQNIYAFRGARNEFIRRFQEDYHAKVEYLVENYRSSRCIIEVANALIGVNVDRMKRDHPIRINHARQNDPTGGRWARLDSLAAGRVQVLAVPSDAIGQAVVVMDEIQRLKALDRGADWSDFAILARNRSTLEPIRAWCEKERVGYWANDGEQGGGPRLHQVREGWTLLSMLRAKPQRRLRPDQLSRWFQARYKGGAGDNPWHSLLRQFIDEIELSWGDSRMPTTIAIEALYEFGSEARHSDGGKITLSTVHGAKGREFKHVVILDGGDWRGVSEEERRLYYVGTTRAKENLVLCEAAGSANPFTPRLDASQVTRCPLPTGIERPAHLSLRYVSLGMRDVDLGYAGRSAAAAAVHREIEALSVNDTLKFVELERSRELQTRAGRAVGRLSKACEMPSGIVGDVTIDALVRRTRENTDPNYLESVKVDVWWVVLATIRVLPVVCAKRIDQTAHPH